MILKWIVLLLQQKKLEIAVLNKGKPNGIHWTQSVVLEIHINDPLNCIKCM